MFCKLHHIVHVIDEAGNRTDSYEFAIVVENLNIDFQKEITKLQKELNRLEKFLVSIEKKLNNKKFLEKASPDIVEREKQKYEGTKIKITNVKDQIQQLKEII